MELVAEIWRGSGLYQITGGQAIMLVICLGLLYLGIAKKFEPLLLVTIGFGGLLSNIPGVEIATGDGLLYFLYSTCLLYTSPSPRDLSTSRMPSSA